MNNLSDSAFVVSVHYDGNGVARLNLKWEGRHEISDFDFNSPRSCDRLRNRNRKRGMGDRAVFTGCAVSQVAARVPIRPDDPQVAQSCAHRRPSPIADHRKGQSVIARC
jgi:hypothetical protein